MLHDVPGSVELARMIVEGQGGRYPERGAGEGDAIDEEQRQRECDTDPHHRIILDRDDAALTRCENRW